MPVAEPFSLLVMLLRLLFCLPIVICVVWFVGWLILNGVA